MNTKHISLMGLLIATVLATEYALIGLPNIQLTFLFFIVAASIFDEIKLLTMIMIYVTIDMLLGGFVPQLYLGWFMAWLVMIFDFKYLSAILAPLVYTVTIGFASIVMYNLNVVAYFTADLPYTIALISSTLLTVIWLYDPLHKTIGGQYEQMARYD